MQATQTSLIDATSKFSGRRPEVPTFSIEELIRIGIESRESEGTLLVEIPLKAQRNLIEALKPFGFGLTEHMPELINRIVMAFGIKGQYQQAIDPGTHSLISWQKKQTQ